MEGKGEDEDPRFTRYLRLTRTPTNHQPLLKILGCIFITFYILSLYSATKSLSTAHISGDDGAPQGRHGDKTNKVRVNTAPLIGQRPSAEADTGL